MLIGKLLVREIAEAKGMTLSQLQRKSTVSLSVLSRYWHGKIRAVSFDVLERIADALEVRIENLITDEETAKTESVLDDLYNTIRQSWLHNPKSKSEFTRGVELIMHHQQIGLDALIQHELLTRYSTEYTVYWLKSNERDTDPSIAIPNSVRERALVTEIQELSMRRTLRESEYHNA